MREKYSSKHRFTLTADEMQELFPFLQGLEKHSVSERLCNNTHIANSEAMIIIARLCDIYQRRYMTNSQSVSEDQEFISSIAYIYQHYNEQILLEEIVKMAKMSRTAYLQKFKKITGTTPQRLQTLHRITISKNLLLQTARSITDIAQAVGFYDLSHFIRVFTNEIGVTPSEYRKKSKEKA